ncbi:VOC family protein [Paenibacillus alkalitolerans]|uniref:VOC family protein n=1 Tax=Paenibacillus alkalitolerans TaxID=2799335 RepID=UPI0018F5C75E|nr:VOC family protein [Paenibacillus alkalitolerans]
MRGNVQGIAYNIIPVTNPETSALWYKNMFGFQVVHRTDDFVSLFVNDRPILVLMKTDDRSRASFTLKGKEHWIITFCTDDIHSLHAHMSQNGVNIGGINDEGEMGKFFSFHDPDGNLIDVWENISLTRRLESLNGQLAGISR